MNHAIIHPSGKIEWYETFELAEAAGRELVDEGKEFTFVRKLHTPKPTAPQVVRGRKRRAIALGMKESGRSMKEIAEQLGVSVVRARSICHHAENIRQWNAMKEPAL